MMRSNPRYTLIFGMFAVVALLAMSFTPSALTQGNRDSKVKAGAANKKANDPRKSVERALRQLEKATGDQKALKSSILISDDDDAEDADDPDLPPWMVGKIDKGEYLRLRGDYI